MNIGDTMNNKDKALMEKYDITKASETVFFYKSYKYKNLDCAVKYAELEAKESLLSPKAKTP